MVSAGFYFRYSRRLDRYSMLKILCRGSAGLLRPFTASDTHHQGLLPLQVELHPHILHYKSNRRLNLNVERLTAVV